MEYPSASFTDMNLMQLLEILAVQGLIGCIVLILILGMLCLLWLTHLKGMAHLYSLEEKSRLEAKRQRQLDQFLRNP